MSDAELALDCAESAAAMACFRVFVTLYLELLEFRFKKDDERGFGAKYLAYIGRRKRRNFTFTLPPTGKLSGIESAPTTPNNQKGSKNP